MKQAVLFLTMIGFASAQGPPAPPITILVIDTENVVTYQDDIADVSKFATDPNITTPIPAPNFRGFLAIGDIVAVNGEQDAAAQVTAGRGHSTDHFATPAGGQLSPSTAPPPG